MQMLTGFSHWAVLLDHIRAEYPLYYRGPMDVRAHRVTATIRKDGTLRVYPHRASDADPFTADAGHLDRFQRDYSRVRLSELVRL